MAASIVYNGFVQSVHNVCMDSAIRESGVMRQKIQTIFEEAKQYIGEPKNAEEILEEMTLYFEDIDGRLDGIQRGKIT